MADIDDVMDKLGDVLDKLDDVLERLEEIEFVSYTICTQCQGTGQIVESYNHGTQVPAPIACPRCNGTGRIVSGGSIEQD